MAPYDFVYIDVVYLNLDVKSKFFTIAYNSIIFFRGHHGRDRMIVVFTTTCVISAYHH